MGFLDKVKSAAGEVVKASVNVATLGHADELEQLVKSDEFVTAATLGTNKLVEGLEDEIEDRKEAKREEARAAAELKATQEKLRKVEFERAEGQQVEAEQLAQREIFRKRQQAQIQAQQQQAAVQTASAQTGFQSSTLQNILTSGGTQAAVASSTLSTDQAKLQKDLAGNLGFLQETFELGGQIGQTSQQLANLQQEAADKQAQLSGFVGSVGAGASIGGPVGAAVGGGAFILNEIFG